MQKCSTLFRQRCFFPLMLNVYPGCVKAAFTTPSLSLGVELERLEMFWRCFVFCAKYIIEQMQNIRPQENL